MLQISTKMLITTFIALLCLWSPFVLCKMAEPVCFQHIDNKGAYPCESRPSKEPLSLQYSKAQSQLFSRFILCTHFLI